MEIIAACQTKALWLTKRGRMTLLSKCRTLDDIPIQFRKHENKKTSCNMASSPIPQPKPESDAKSAIAQKAKRSKSDILFVALLMLVMVDGESFLFGH
jgi:hypothetical protein